jgi:hypothetical protein
MTASEIINGNAAPDIHEIALAVLPSVVNRAPNLRLQPGEDWDLALAEHYRGIAAASYSIADAMLAERARRATPTEAKEGE